MTKLKIHTTLSAYLTAVIIIISRGVAIRVADKIQVESRKRDLALKAAGLFSKQGYIRTSMRDIARNCGLTTGALYHYFRSKDDILSLFQEITASELQKFAEENLEDLYKMPPLEAITGVIEAIISFIDKTQDVTVFWYQEARNLNPVQMALLFQREDHEISLIKKILQWGCETGEFKIKDVNLLAHDIIVLCDMWAFRRWMLRRDYTVEQFKQAQTELILSRIKK